MTQDQLSMTFSALGDPTRRAILVRLSQGEASVSEIAEPFMKTMSAPAITKHLKVLENAGLITRSRAAQWRPCKLNGEPFREISEWIEHYRVFWEESFDRLDAYLKTMTQKQNIKSEIKKTKTLKTKGKKNGHKK